MKSLILSACLAAAFPAFAAETIMLDKHPAIQNPTLLKDAVQLQMSPRGQKLFSNDMLGLLTNLGVVIDENYFPAFDYVSEQPISIDELAKNNPKEFAMLQKVRNYFNQYLQGIEFKDFKPAVQVGNSQYTAEFEKLSLVTDEKLMKALGKKDGAILAIEMSVKNLAAGTTSVKLEDQANPWIGKVEVQNPQVQLGTKDQPLTARMPFYVKVLNGKLTFEALQIEENIDRVPVEVKYRRIILPEYEWGVAGSQQKFKIKLNEAEFKKLVDENIPQGLTLVRKYLREFLQNDLPKLLNEKAQDALKTELEQIQPLEAPGTKDGDKRPPFALGLKLSQLDIINSQLAVKLDAFIEDTSLSKSTELWKNSGAKAPPVFNHLDPSQYDIAIGVDSVLFNRAIHLAFNRGNFNSVETCPGEPTIKLRSPPKISASKIEKNSQLETSMSLFIDAETHLSDNERKKFGIPFVKETLHLSMQYNALVKPAAPGSAKLQIFLTKPDDSTIWIDPNSLTLASKLIPGVEGIIRKQVIEKLSGESSCGSNEPLAEFKLIDSILSVPLEYAKIKLDPSGQFMLYMNYKK